MIVDSTSSKTQVVLQQQRSGWDDKVAHREHHRGHRPEHNYKDRFEFSDAAKLSATRMRKLDLDKQPEAEHALNIEIITSVVKKITGQDLQLFSPLDLQDSADQVSVQEPTNAPQQPSTADFESVYPQSMAYFTSQMTTFSAQGTINTKDGQQVEFSVSLTMSKMVYAEFNSAQTDSAQTDKNKMAVNFSGTAAELTTTHFQFSFDTQGSDDQVDTAASDADSSTQTAYQAAADQPIVSASTTEKASESAGNNGAADNRLTAALKSIYRQLRIWQHHSDGSTQLLALGAKSIGALYLGHLTASMSTLASENKSSLVETGYASALPTTSQPAEEQQINFTV